MKLQTIMRIYEVLKSEGYKPTILVGIVESKYTKTNFGWVKLKWKVDNNKETLWSRSYKVSYLLRKLDGIPFDIKQF